MSRLVLSEPAKGDLQSIWLYSARQWGRNRADTYLASLQASIEKTAGKPERGRSCDEIRPGYWRLSSGSHVVFYRITDDGIDVVRILHQSMDFQRHL